MMGMSVYQYLRCPAPQTWCSPVYAAQWQENKSHPRSWRTCVPLLTYKVMIRAKKKIFHNLRMVCHGVAEKWSLVSEEGPGSHDCIVGTEVCLRRGGWKSQRCQSKVSDVKGQEVQTATWRDHKATQEEHGVLGKDVSRKKEEIEQPNSFQCQELSSAGCSNVSNGGNRWVRM